jgi:hypothetical protein
MCSKRPATAHTWRLKPSLPPRSAQPTPISAAVSPNAEQQRGTISRCGPNSAFDSSLRTCATYAHTQSTSWKTVIVTVGATSAGSYVVTRPTRLCP